VRGSADSVRGEGRTPLNVPDLKRAHFLLFVSLSGGGGGGGGGGDPFRK